MRNVQASGALPVYVASPSSRQPTKTAEKAALCPLSQNMITTLPITQHSIPRPVNLHLHDPKLRHPPTTTIKNHLTMKTLPPPIHLFQISLQILLDPILPPSHGMEIRPRAGVSREPLLRGFFVGTFEGGAAGVGDDFAEWGR